MTKQEESKRTAEKRVNAALNSLTRVGNLSGWRYDLDAADVARIFEVLEDALQKQRERFHTQGRFSFEKSEGTQDGTADR